MVHTLRTAPGVMGEQQLDRRRPALLLCIPECLRIDTDTPAAS